MMPWEVGASERSPVKAATEEKDFNRYLIIGGASRSGTTSLFNTLAGHPDICASKIKETRFFLDKHYPLSRKYTQSAGLSAYRKYFRNCPETKEVYLEATPDYLYNRSALAIWEYLPNARVVFILRDPADRLGSFYSYAMQRSLIPRSMGFEEFCEQQVIADSADPDTPIPFRVAAQGQYARYLRLFNEVAADKILLVDFHAMVTEPHTILRRICEFAGVSPGALEGQALRNDNASFVPRFRSVERIYTAVRQRLIYLFMNRSVIMRILKNINHGVKRALNSNVSVTRHAAVGDNFPTVLPWGGYETEYRLIETLASAGGAALLADMPEEVL